MLAVELSPNLSSCLGEVRAKLDAGRGALGRDGPARGARSYRVRELEAVGTKGHVTSEVRNLRVASELWAKARCAPPTASAVSWGCLLAVSDALVLNPGGNGFMR